MIILGKSLIFRLQAPPDTSFSTLDEEYRITCLLLYLGSILVNKTSLFQRTASKPIANVSTERLSHLTGGIRKTRSWRKRGYKG
jgi:hypothetical protein